MIVSYTLILLKFGQVDSKTPFYCDVMTANTTVLPF